MQEVTTMQEQRDTATRRFTLIELMVVISIIMILMAMLMPAIDAAREKGRSAVCTSNLHQLLLAILSYHQDSDDWNPYLQQGTKIFPDYMRDYVEGGDECWQCPSGDFDPNPNGCPNGMVLHYGMNHYDYDDVDGDGIDNHMPGLGGRHMRAVVNPDETLFFADADPTSSPHNIGGAQNGTTAWPFTSLSESRHNDAYNAIMLGGSIERYPNKPNHEIWATPKR